MMNRSQSNSTSKLWMITISILFIHLICYRATKGLNKSIGRTPSYSPLALSHLNKRSISSTINLKTTTTTIISSNDLINTFEEEEHEEPEPASLIDYRRYYESTTSSMKPFVFISMALWLTFLFAFVGITAADFFCPNLSTIASRLGMSESVAGVTFLAFSNGSPDVFSTFAALRTNSGALAIGELLGAASFIVSVVAGTMCVITPFRVSRHSFLRDVGFFTIAVLFTLGILYDNHIHAWEAIAMVSLYFVYVMVVGFQSWWLSRKAKRDALIREARDEYAVESNSTEYFDDPSSTSNRSVPSSAFQLPITPIETNRPSHSHHFLSQDTFQSLSDRSTTGVVTLTRTTTTNNNPNNNPNSSAIHQQQSQSSYSAAPTLRRPKTRSTVRPSLLGAIEFRDVVNSLRADSTARTLAVFGGGVENGLGDIHARFIGAEDDNGGMSAGGGRRSGGGGGGGRLSRSTSISSSGILPGFNQYHQGAETGGGNVSASSSRPKHSRKVSWSPGMTVGKPDEDEEEGSRGFWEEPMENNNIAGGDGINSNGNSKPGSRVSSRRGSLANSSPFGALGSGFTENPWQATMDRRPLRLDLSNLPSPSNDPTTSNARSARSPAAGGNTLSLTPSPNIPLHKTLRRVPSILLTTATGDQTTVLEARPTSPPWSEFQQRRSYKITRAVFLALFPSLQDFKSKSLVGKATALLCVPAILVLNSTLPVVDHDEEDCESLMEKDQEDCSSDDYDSPGLGERGGEEEEEDNLIDLSESSQRNTPVVMNNDFFSFKPQSRRNHHPHHSQQHRTSTPQSPEEDLNSPTESESKANREAISRQFHSRAIPHPDHEQHSHHRQITSSSPEIESPHVERFEITNSDSSANKIPPSRGASMTNFEGMGEGGDERCSDDLQELSNGVLTRWLTAVQCTLAPVFCITALFGYDLEWWYPLVALVAGLSLATVAFHLFEDPKHPGRITLCFVGFFVAMVWILTIVNEVVGVLQTFGHIFGLSDAILGLTIFAMGNSLGDLVANATVARMGFPSMAIAACFGGPMLNILLGIGLSGSYVIFKNGGEPYEVQIGSTLLVSGVGLLTILVATLIIVPMNDYIMNKQIGIALISAYGIVLTATVAVEIWS